MNFWFTSVDMANARTQGRLEAVPDPTFIYFANCFMGLGINELVYGNFLDLYPVGRSVLAPKLKLFSSLEDESQTRNLFKQLLYDGSGSAIEITDNVELAIKAAYRYKAFQWTTPYPSNNWRNALALGGDPYTRLKGLYNGTNIPSEDWKQIETENYL
jgi:hypothetical protein